MGTGCDCCEFVVRVEDDAARGAPGRAIVDEELHDDVEAGGGAPVGEVLALGAPGGAVAVDAGAGVAAVGA